MKMNIPQDLEKLSLTLSLRKSVVPTSKGFIAAAQTFRLIKLRHLVYSTPLENGLGLTLLVFALFCSGSRFRMGPATVVAVLQFSVVTSYRFVFILLFTSCCVSLVRLFRSCFTVLSSDHQQLLLRHWP